MMDERESENHIGSSSFRGGKAKKTRRVSLRVSGHHGKGLGLGEVNVSNGGEGDGCDRCGCLDEEVSLSLSS